LGGKIKRGKSPSRIVRDHKNGALSKVKGHESNQDNRRKNCRHTRGKKGGGGGGGGASNYAWGGKGQKTYRRND